VNMLPYELRSEALPRYPYPVACVFESQIVPHADEAASLLGPSATTASDEWLEGVFVVDESRAQDVLEVAVNLSFVERHLGTSSAEAIKAARRVTLEAFSIIGATRVHRLRAASNSRPVQAAIDRYARVVATSRLLRWSLKRGSSLEGLCGRQLCSSGTGSAGRVCCKRCARRGMRLRQVCLNQASLDLVWPAAQAQASAIFMMGLLFSLSICARCCRQQVQQALAEAIERQKRAGAATAFRSLFLVLILVGLVAAIAFKKTTSEKK
jgi:hypothetical protein